MKVLTFGELLLRLSAPGYEKLFQSDSLKATFCGGEANVAVSLANFGVNSCFVTKLPDNDIGHASARSLDYFKVDTSKIIYGEGRMGLYYLEKGASQRPSKIIYDRQYSAMSLANEGEFNWDDLLKDVDWFHWTGITPALSNNCFNILLKACKKAKEKGIIVSCDLNYRKKLWSSDDAQKAMRELVKYVDVCIGNEEDAQLALGIESNSNVENAELSISDYENIARTIEKEYGCRYVAFTLRESYSASRNGWSGIFYHNGKSFVSKKYDIQLIDRVGGGDSFSAGLIYSLINKMDEDKAINFAVSASCLKQTIEGDYNRISVDDVFSLMENGGNGRIKR